MGTGKTYSTKYLLDSNNSSGVAGQVLSTTSTGIDWVDANTVPGSGLWLANGNNIYNSNSGNVGIGTTSPTAKLQVAGTTTYNSDTIQALRVCDATDVSKGIHIGFDTVQNAGIIQAGDFGVSYRNLSLNPNFGNVGIGTTSPNNKLDVNGDVFINSNYTANVAAQDLTIGKTTTGNHGLTIVTGPTYTGSIYFGDSGNNDAGIIKYQHSNNSMQFVTNRSEAMRIDTSGNVGIGATNPLRKLHVVGQLAVNNATTEYYGVLMSGGEGADPSVLIGDWHNSSGTIKWDSTGSYLRIDSQHSTANAAILFSGNDGSTEYMRIASTGNVGIGTTTVQNKLVVRDSGSAFNSTLQNSTASIISKELTDNAYHSILQLVAVRQSLTTGKDSQGYLGFSTVDDSNNQGQLDAGRIAIVNETGSSRNSATALTFWTNPGGTQTTAAVEKMRISSAGAIKFNAYNSTNNTGTPTYMLGTDASGNVVKVLGGDIPGGGGTVTGTGSATQVAFWDTNTSLSGNSQLYWDNTSGFLGINDTTPSSRLKIISDTVDTNIYTVDIKHARNDANVATHAMRINVDLSGADTTTADRTNSGLLIDIDSSANGDATHEHRIFGVNSQVNFTGFTDIARGGYFLAESNYTAAKTSQLAGVYGYAIHDANDAAGGVSNMYGVYGISSIQDTGDVDNAFGVYGNVAIGDGRVTDVGVTKGVEGEITIDKSTALNYGNMIGISSIIDNNEGAVPNFGNQYLFKGDYQGTKGSDAYGLFIEGDKHYLAGKLGLNNTDPTYRLDVAGSARVTGAFYDSNDSPGTSGQVLSSTVTGTDWIDGSAIPGVPSGSGTLNTIPLWTPDGDTLGNSIITQPSTGVVRVSGDSVYFSVTDTSAAARNIDIGHWVSGQTNIESQGGTLSIGTQSNHNIVFETNGSTKATILSGGNVGIGVTSPDFKLQIATPAVLTNSTYSWPFDLTRANSNTRGFSIGVQSGGGPVALSNHNGDILLGQTFGVDANGLPQFYETMRVKHDGTASSGKVGIGTTNPNTGKLVVAGAAYSISSSGQSLGGIDLRANANGGAGSYSAGISFGGASSGRAAISGVMSSASTDGDRQGLAFFTHGSGTGAADSIERMRLDSSGNFGIGTDNPVQTLQVNGQVLFRTTTVDGGKNRFQLIPGGSSDAANLYLYYGNTGDGTLSVRINAQGDSYLNGGNVGIGVTAPAQKLHVGDGGIRVEKFATGLGGFITIGNATETSGNYSAYFFGNTPSDTNYFKGGIAYETLSATFGRGDMHFLQNDSSDATNATISDSVMTILNGGNVGIGTTSPTSALDVEAGDTGAALGDSTTAAIFRAGRQNVWFQNQRTAAGTDWNNNTFKIIAKIDTTSHQSINFVNDASFNEHIDIYTGNQAFNTRFSANGNVGIGTTGPAAKLHVLGSVILDSYSVSDPDPTSRAAYPAGQMFTHYSEANGVSIIGGQGGYSGASLTIGEETTRSSNFKFIRGISDTNGGGNAAEEFWVNGIGGAYFAGNVGIGVTNPANKLEVDGHIKVLGRLKLGPSSSIQLDDTPTASTASGSGTIVNWSVSDTTTAGTLYTVKTNGLWTPVDADNESTSIGMLAIALDSNAMNGMLLQGFFYKASHGFTIGLPLYISNTAGAFSTTRPTGTNDYVRIIGYATSANYIYFDPDKTWVQVA